MKAYRQLLTVRASKKGLVYIQLTAYWGRLHLRSSTL